VLQVQETWSLCFRCVPIYCQVDKTFAMVSFLSTNTVSSVGWYVESGASRHMTYGMSLFNMIQELEGGTIMELDNDVVYHVRGVVSISF